MAIVQHFSRLLAILLMASCTGGSPSGDENVLARVGKEYLYESELKGIVPPGTGVTDSISIVRNYINNWVSQRVFLEKAIANLREEDMKFEKQLEEYRNSLIIYKYESELVRQNLDTVITDQELEAYYNGNPENFQLKNNIVRVYYARFDQDLQQLRQIRRFFYSEVPEHRDSVDRYIENYADLYFLNDEAWILFSDVLKFVPIETYNQEAFLQNNVKLEIREDPYIYFVSFSDFRIKDGVSPLSFEKENIRQIILNKRRLTIINNMREEVFNAALERSEFEIY
jgi:hypothetical protein